MVKLRMVYYCFANIRHLRSKVFLQIVAVASSCEQDHFNTGALTNLKNSVCNVSNVLNEMTDMTFDSIHASIVHQLYINCTSIMALEKD